MVQKDLLEDFNYRFVYFLRDLFNSGQESKVTLLCSEGFVIDAFTPFDEKTIEKALNRFLCQREDYLKRHQYYLDDAHLYKRHPYSESHETIAFYNDLYDIVRRNKHIVSKTSGESFAWTLYGVIEDINKL